VRRAYLRGLLVSQPFGVRNRRFHAADVLDWISRGAPTRVARRSARARYVFGSPAGEFQDSFKTAWESPLLIANGFDTKRAMPKARVDRARLRQVDLHWHDLRTRAPVGSSRTGSTSALSS
jgi:hypothetical protein